MKKIAVLFMLLCTSFFSYGQAAPLIQWQQCYGVAIDDEKIFSIDTLQNGGGYIFCGQGNCGSNTTSDFWVVKIDTGGQVLWQQCYDNQGYIDQAACITTTNDGGYIVVGTTTPSISTERDLWIIKINTQGSLVWQKTLGGSQDDAGIPYIAKTTDGNYAVGCSTQSNDGDVSGNHGGWDLWLVKLTDMGNILWKKTIGSSADDALQIMNTTKDNGLLIGGTVTKADGDVQLAYSTGNGWAAKVSAAGNIVWQYTIVDSVNGSNLQSVCETKDHGYIFSRDNYYTAPYGGHILMKIDAAKNVLWQKTRLNLAIGQSVIVRLQQAPDSGFILDGERYGGLSENDNSMNYYIARIDANGETLWSKEYGGSNHDWLMRTKQTMDGGYILAGYTLSNDGNVSGNHGAKDGWIVKLQPDPLTNVKSIATNFGKVAIYPNPATDIIHFSEKATVRIINQQGETVIREFEVQQVPINTLPIGNYLILLFDKKGQLKQVEKLTKI